MPADKKSNPEGQKQPGTPAGINEKIIVAAVIIVTLLSAASALLIVTNLEVTIGLPGFSSQRAHYSSPITVLTQSAPDSNGRNAYVRMTVIASTSSRRDARMLENQQAIVKSTISQVLQNHTPASLLEPDQLTLIQRAMADAILQELNIVVDDLYLDRITIQ